jgi:hypothetical protein
MWESIKDINQKGFAVLHIVLILIVVVIVGFAGWYVYKANKDTSSTLNNLDNSEISITATPTPTQSEANSSESAGIDELMDQCITKANNEPSPFTGSYSFTYSQYNRGEGENKYFDCAHGNGHSISAYYDNQWVLLYAGNGWTGETTPCDKYQGQEQLYNLCKEAVLNDFR